MKSGGQYQIVDLYFIGGNKHKHHFFVDLIEKNKCMALNQISELLIELYIGDCKF